MSKEFDLGPVDLIPDPVIGVDADRRIDLWNRAAELLYGFTRAEAVGRRPNELLSSRFPTAELEIREELADSGQWQGNLVQRTKDGRELTVETRWVVRYDDDGASAGGLAIDRDITVRIEGENERQRDEAAAERGRMQGRLSRVQRLESIGQLAGGIAHDFNNLLAIIINYSAMIAGELDGLARDATDQRWRSMIEDLMEVQLAAERAARLTHHLLAFSRQDLRNPVTVDVGASVRGIEELLRRTLGEHIRLEVILGREPHSIRIDPGQLDQVLVNLAVNSRDAMPTGGTLAIDAARIEIDAEYGASRSNLSPGAHIRLRVSDTGCGMTQEVIEHAFDPFFTTRPVGEGTGLGLATVFGIVSRAGGWCQLYSEPGLGTTFVAVFPAVISESRAEPTDTEGSALRGAETILLVEDEHALRDVARRILVGAGYEVIDAATGALALDAADAHKGMIDLLLSDVIMPEIQGPQLAQLLRERRPEMRVLYVSGFAEPFLRGAMHLEQAKLLSKPFTASSLLGSVRDALTSTCP